MSWYLFQSSPQSKLRGIKVNDFQNLHRQKLNLSWGMNEPTTSIPKKQQYDQIIPTTTIVNKANTQNQKMNNMNNIRVLTDSSDNEQQELMKLIKNQNEKTRQRQVLELFNKNKRRSQSNKANNEQYRVPLGQQSKPNNKDSQINMRMRYLQNSLLPQCRRDSMAAILDYKLNKELPLNQSRVSGKSVLHNKKNQSNVVLGNGFNIFTSSQQPKKELYQKFQEMYDYQQKYKKRVENNHIKFG